VLEALPPPQPTLVTERLILRPLRDADAPAVAAGAGDKRVAKYLIQVPSPYPLTLARAWVRHRIEWWELGRGVTLAIGTRAQPDELLGTVSLRRYARDKRAELGYWLGHAAWGLGYATEACHAIVDYGFRQLGLARVYAMVLAGNATSERVLDKLGMVREGVQRQHVRKGRRLVDVTLYGVLRADWR
jgi:ribosomal-protein-alanine N-acetyltransferase